MRGIAIIGGGSFNNSSLPKISIKHVPVIPDARYDWAADNMQLGPTQVWWDQVQAGRLISTDEPGNWPTSVQGTNRFMSFNGATNKLETQTSMAGEKTLVIVGRFPEPASGQFMVSGGVGAGPYNFHINSAGNYAFNNGGNITSAKAADTFWHCFIIVTKGTGSVLRIDGQEWTANLPDSTATMLKLGGTGSTLFKSQISRLTVLPYAADVHERSSIHAVMKAHYNLF